MPKKIIVNISNEGQIKAETDEYKGDSCVSAIKELFSEFVEIEEFDYKTDYYEEEVLEDTEVKIY